MTDDPTADSDDPPLPLEQPAEPMTGDIPVPPMTQVGELIEGTRRTDETHAEEAAEAWRELERLRDRP